MGGLGFVGCGWVGKDECCVDRGFWVCLARFVGRIVVVGGFEAPRLGWEWMFVWELLDDDQFETEKT